MADEKKPEQTPREIIAKLAAMSPEEFNQFMAWHFANLWGAEPPVAPADGQPPSGSPGKREQQP